MLEVKRKGNESFEAMLRRFTKKTIQSGKILQARKIRFFNKPKTKKDMKDTALRRKEITSKMDYLKKIGKLDEYAFKNKKRR